MPGSYFGDVNYLLLAIERQEKKETVGMVEITNLKGRSQLEIGLNSKGKEDKSDPKGIFRKQQANHLWRKQTIFKQSESSKSEATLPVQGAGPLSKFFPSRLQEESNSPQD